MGRNKLCERQSQDTLAAELGSETGRRKKPMRRVLSSLAGCWSATPLGSSGRQYRTHLRVTYHLSTHHCFMAALRDMNSPALLRCVGLSMLPARTQRVTGLLCVVVDTEGTRAGHKQCPLHCLSSCSLPTQRPGITSQSVGVILALFSSMKTVCGRC